MMEPITELRLRDAARQAVANGHAVAAILFGSRARGSAAPQSDWDVCLITNDEQPRSEEDRDRALEAENAFWDDGRIERVWLARSDFEAGVPASSFKEAIAREGRVLAGDATMSKHATVTPFSTEAVRNDMSRAARALGEAINAARSHARETDEHEARHASMDMSLRAIGAVEALGRTLCALTHTEHTGTHDVARNGRRIRDRASEPEAPLDRTLTEQIGTRLIELNGGARKVRLAEYGKPGESHEHATQRLSRALHTDIEIRRGLVEGEGPWAELKRHPRRDELAAVLERDTAARAATNSREWVRDPVSLPDQSLNGAVGQWIKAYQKIRAALERRGNREVNREGHTE